MSLITPELITILLILTALCLVFNLVKGKKIKNAPMLSEEAVVQNKSPNSNRFDSLFTVDFLIVSSNTVVTCKVPHDVWNNLDNDQRGILTHKGGFLHSFECNGVTYTAYYPSGLTL